MKKTKSAPVKRARAKPKTIDQYLARVPEPARTTLQKVRAIVRSAAPEAEEIISYGIPAFRHQSVLVWFGAFSNHCSFFPTAGVTDKFKNDLKGYTVSKGTIRFPIDKPLPSVLIKKIVKARLADVERNRR